MSRNNPISRRTAMKLTGAAAATALVAGCSDDDTDDENGAENGGENGDEDVDTEEWEDVDEIELDGDSGGWEGVAPDMIDGEENPTLVLFEGESYDITWENTDGANHNLEIVDEDDDVVDDYETDNMGDEGETQTLEVDEVSEDMYEYVCRPHEGPMRGEVVVEEAPNGDEENGDEENGDENGEEENGEENGDDENGNDDDE